MALPAAERAAMATASHNSRWRLLMSLSLLLAVCGRPAAGGFPGDETVADLVVEIVGAFVQDQTGASSGFSLDYSAASDLYLR